MDKVYNLFFILFVIFVMLCFIGEYFCDDGDKY